MTADPVGGVWTYALELAGALAGRAEFLLATMGAPLDAAQRREAQQLSNVELVESTLKLEWMEDPWADVARAGEWLLGLAEGFRPHVVHVNGYAHAALRWKAPVVSVAHSCVLSWWWAVHGHAAPPSRYAAEMRRGLEAATLVVAPTTAMLDALALSGAELRRKRVIPNGRSRDRFRPGRKRNVVLAAGRIWDEAKNLESLARVAGRLPWPVRIAGDRSHPGGGEKTFEGVEFLGRLSPADLGRQLGEASIYCLPARYEPFGLSVLEAALAGCALVLGDIESLRENWTDAAVFVPPGDDEALERAVLGLIADFGRGSALRDRARARAQSFTPRRMADSYLEVYRALVSGAAAAAANTLCA